MSDTQIALIILGACLVPQYILATVALIRLAPVYMTTKKYILWNVFIMSAFFIGSVTWLIYESINKNKLVLRSDIKYGRDAIPPPSDENIKDDN